MEEDAIERGYISELDLESSHYNYVGRIISDFVVHQIEERSNNGMDAIFKAIPGGCEVGLCRLDLLAVDGKSICPRRPPGDPSGLRSHPAPDEFIRQLEDDRRVFSYAVTPKESVQRISNISHYERVGESLLGLSLGVLGEDTKSASQVFAELINRNQRLEEAAVRRPLVIGLADTWGDPEKVAAFGWLIGPRFEIGEDGSKLRFRHVPMQNDLSAIVSVPSWWRAAKIEVSTCWIHENGLPPLLSGFKHRLEEQFASYQDCLKETPRKYTISLPGSFAEIPRALGFDVIRRPHVGPVPDQPVVLQAEAPAHILIQGGDLWRSTVVTLGSQKADEIVVLPDMNAIIAGFDKVFLPAMIGYQPTGMESAPTAHVQLRVWTSEGMAFAGLVSIVPKPRDEQLVTPVVTPTPTSTNPLPLTAPPKTPAPNPTLPEPTCQGAVRAAR